MEHVLADLSVVTKATVEEIVECHYAKWTSSVHWHILKAVKSIFKDALKASSFYTSNGLKTFNFNVVELELGKVV